MLTFSNKSWTDSKICEHSAYLLNVLESTTSISLAKSNISCSTFWMLLHKIKFQISSKPRVYFNNSGRLWSVKISFAIWSYSRRFCKTILAASKSDLAVAISSFSCKIFWSLKQAIKKRENFLIFVSTNLLTKWINLRPISFEWF